MANDDKVVVEQPKSKKGLIIAIVAVLNVVAIAAAFFILTSKGGEDEKQNNTKQRSRETRQSAVEGPIVDLEGFVVNLNTGREKRYLKTKMSVQLFGDEDIPQFEKFSSIVRNEILLQLSAIELDTVSTIEGKRELEKTLAKKVNERLDMDRVANVYFTEFVTQ